MLGTLHAASLILPSIMSEFILIEMEGTYPEDSVVFIKEEPGVADGVKVAHYVLVTGRSVALHAHDGNFTRLAPCHIGNDDGMSVFPPWAGRVDEDIARLYILDGTWLGLVIEGVGAAYTIYAPHVFLEGFA